MASFVFYLFMSLLLFVAVLLILLVLIQKGRGGGLSSAFGGSGGSTAFGAKTGDVLTWATSIVFGVFILLAVILDLVVNHQYASTTPTDTTSTAATAETSTPTTVAPINGTDRITQELARLKQSAAATTMPTTLPTGFAIPHVPVEATTLPAVPSFKVPSLMVPTTAPAATQPH